MMYNTKDIDPEIRRSIGKLNKYGWVRTFFSCSGQHNKCTSNPYVTLQFPFLPNKRSNIFYKEAVATLKKKFEVMEVPQMGENIVSIYPVESSSREGRESMFMQSHDMREGDYILKPRYSKVFWINLMNAFDTDIKPIEERLRDKTRIKLQRL